MTDAIQLTEEETKQINEMMADNAEQESVQELPINEEAQAAIETAYKDMKKLLKRRSKNELVHVVWTYATQLQEMQRVAQILLEENKELKAQLGVSND